MIIYNYYLGSETFDNCGCHFRFLSASEVSEPPKSHISTSLSARGDVCHSAIR